MSPHSDPDDFLLDPGFRGVPPSVGNLSSALVGAQGWTPAGGMMSLPLLSVDLPTFARNLAAMKQICAVEQASIAPHIKTPMSPALARRMIAAGAWGVSVADVRQAHVMLRGGIRRLILANEVGGPGGARRLESLCASCPDAEIQLFCDSPAALAALEAAWSGSEAPKPSLLLEVGMGRGGTTTDKAFETLLAQAKESPFKIAGIAAYEGTAMRPHTDESGPLVAAFLERVRYAIHALRRSIPDGPLVLSIGGSALFDYVFEGLRGLRAADPDLRLVLRSGAAVFGDHGMIRRRLDWVVARGLLAPEICKVIAQEFQPTLRLWAEVLSIPGEGKAIVGLGMRDAGDDQGLPEILRLWRGGVPVASLEGAEFVKLNDQHGFISVPGANVGDVIEFGVKHPCTTIDKHAVIYGLGGDGKVEAAFRTFFG